MAKTTKPNNTTNTSNRRQNRKSRRNINNGPLDSQSIMRVLGQLPNQTRSGKQPNPADPRTSLSLNMGRTLSGALAAQKILHPCGEYDIQPVKIPDGAVSTSVVLERRDEYEIRAPTTIGTSTSWNSLVVHQPFLNHRDIVLRWPGSISISEETFYNILTYINQTDYTGPNPTAAIYPTFKLCSTMPDAPSGTPVYGTVEYSIMASSTLSPALLANDENHTSLYKDIRRTACGYTTDLDASQLYNQGRVVSGQWTPSVTKGIFDQTQQVTTGGTTPGQVTVVINAYDTWDYTIPAVTSSTIVSSDLFRRQAEAKYGCYMPMRLCAADVPFTSSSALRQIRSLSPGESAVRPDTNLAQRSANDIYLESWSVGVDLWLNLDPHAQLRIKVVENLELDPAPSSTFSPFMSPGYSRDDQALSIIREFARTSPHAYDADFNRLNKMFTNLISGLGDVLSSLGIPIVSAISKPIANFVTDTWGYKAPLPTGVPPDQGMTLRAPSAR